MTTARNVRVLAVLAALVVIVITMDTGRAATPYSTYSMHGTYRFTFTGLAVPAMVPHSGVGIIVADGVGNFTGTETINQGGLFCPDIALNGTYNVGPNGIGSLSAVFSSPLPGCSGDFTLALLVIDGGNVVKGVSSGTSFVSLSQEFIRE